MFNRIKNSLKGQAETPFILSMAIILSFLVFMGASLFAYYPNITIITQFDVLVFGATIVGVAAACALATGIPCAAALVVANLVTFLTASNSLVYTLIFLPLSVTTAYVVARLGRGGG